MPWDTVKERVVSLGVPKTGASAGAPGADDASRTTTSNSYKIESNKQVIFSFDAISSEAVSVQIQYCNDDINWIDGDTITTDGQTGKGPRRIGFVRFLVKVTETTPTVMANVILRVSAFGDGKVPTVAVSTPKASYSINMHDGDYRFFKERRANLTLMGDSISNTTSPYLAYGIMRKWRPLRWAGMNLPLSEGNSGTSGVLLSGSTGAQGSGEAAEHITGKKNQTRPDPDNTFNLVTGENTTDPVLDVNKGYALSPNSGSGNVYQMIDTDNGNTSGGATTGHRMMLVNPDKTKWIDSATPPLYRGEAQPTVNDIPFVREDFRFSTLIYTSEETSLHYVTRPFTDEADPAGQNISLSKGFNTIRITPQTATGNFDASGNYRQEVYSRMAAGVTASFVKVSLDSPGVAGMTIDYIGGGTWSAVDHTSESSSEARSFSFDDVAGDGLSRTGKSYYRNEALQEGLKFHGTNIIMIMLGANNTAGSNDFADIKAMRERIKVNARSVGLHPKVLYVHTYDLDGGGADRARLERDVEELARQNGDMVINLRQMVEDKLGAWAAFKGVYLLAVDSLHPSTTGADEFAELIWSRIEQARQP